MLLDRVSNPGPLTYESGALPIALRGPARRLKEVSRSGEPPHADILCCSQILTTCIFILALNSLSIT